MDFDDFESSPPAAPTGDDEAPVIVLAPAEDEPPVPPQIPSAPVDFDSFMDPTPSFSEPPQSDFSSYQSIPLQSEPAHSYEPEPIQSYEPAPSMSFLPDPEPEDALA